MNLVSSKQIDEKLPKSVEAFGFAHLPPVVNSRFNAAPADHSLSLSDTLAYTLF